ncbi:MAG: LysR family transcriptional regulator [Ruminococcus sp.]
MDIQQLNCFISVAQTLNFSEAARRNFVSQSTVSRYIGDLEKEFGVQLFTRSHRDVLLTNEGKTLLPYALEMIATLGKAKKVIDKLQNGGTGKLSVGCDVTSPLFPSRCIADFTAKYSGISVELKKLDAADRSAAITGGEFDYCFMPRDMVPESSGIETVVTHTESLVVVSSAESPLKGRKSISLSELAAQRLVLLSESSAPILYMEIMDMMRTFHLTPVIDSTYDELIELYMAVLSHMGAAIVPQSLAEMAAPGKTVMLPIDDADTGIAYVMAWSKALSNPVGSLFVETVRKYALGDDGGYGL